MADRRIQDQRLTIAFLVQTTENRMTTTGPEVQAHDREESATLSMPHERVGRPNIRTPSDRRHGATASPQRTVAGALTTYQEKLKNLQKTLGWWSDGSGDGLYRSSSDSAENKATSSVAESAKPTNAGGPST